jgi:hypothetical protein
LAAFTSEGTKAGNGDGAAKQGGRKSRSGSEKRKRDPIIGFRATAEERAQIEANAGRAGLTVGSYVRSRSLKKPTTRAVRRAPVETAQLAQLLGLLGAAGGELQRLAAIPGNGGDNRGEEVNLAIADFRAAASAILRALGKRA